MLVSDETETALDVAATATSEGARRPGELLERGDTLGRYVVLARLGAGGMGVMVVELADERGIVLEVAP